MLSRLRLMVSNEDGNALVDALVGVIVIVIAVTGLTSVATATANAVYSTGLYMERTNYIRSEANELATHVGTVSTTPATETVAVKGTDVKVTTWRVDQGANTAVVHVATSGWSDMDGSECVNPASLDSHCTTVEIPVTIRKAQGIVTTSVAPTWANPAVASTEGATLAAGDLGSFHQPAGTTEVRYVLRVTNPGVPGAGPAELRFMAGTVLLDSLWVDEATDSFLYGSLTLAGATDVTVTLAGSPAHLSQFYVYEAPK